LRFLGGGQVAQQVIFLAGRMSVVGFHLMGLAALYSIGRRFGSRAAGLLMAGYMATFPPFVEQAHYIKPDVPLTCLSLIALWAALRAIDGEDRWLGVSLGVALLAFITKYSALATLGVPLLAAVAKYWNRPRRLLPVGGLLLVGVAVGLVVIDWQVDLVGTMQSFRRTRVVFDAPTALRLPGAVKNWEDVQEAVGWPGLLIAGAGLPLALGLRRFRGAAVYQKSVVAVVYTVAYFVAVSRFSYTGLRDLFPVVAGLAIAWGLALAWLAPPRYAIGALAVGAALLAPWAWQSWQRGDEIALPSTFAMTGDWFIEHVPQGSRVVVERESPLTGYAGFPGPPIYHSRVVDSLFEATVEEYRAQGIEYLIADQWAGDRGGFFNDPDRPGYTDLERVATFESRSPQEPDRIILRVPPYQQHELYRWLGDEVSFRGYDLPEATVRPGGKLRVRLYWMSVRTTDANYTVFVHLVDPATGSLLAQHDGPPVDGLHPTWTWLGDMQFFADEHVLDIPKGAEAGVYTLRVGMYDPITSERLPVRDVDGTSLGDGIELGEVRVKK
jgi:hypothetical protein